MVTCRFKSYHPYKMGYRIMVVFLTLTQAVAVRICISQLICRISTTVQYAWLPTRRCQFDSGILHKIAPVMELVYILDSKSKFSRFESWLGYKLTGGVPKCLKGTDLKSVRPVTTPVRGLESHRLLHILQIYKE